MNVKQFLRAHVFAADGHTVTFQLLHAMYVSAAGGESPLCHRVKFSRAIHAAGLKTAVSNNNRTRVVNVSLNPKATPAKRLKLRKGKPATRPRIAKAL